MYNCPFLLPASGCILMMTDNMNKCHLLSHLREPSEVCNDLGDWKYAPQERFGVFKPHKSFLRLCFSFVTAQPMFYHNTHLVYYYPNRQ